MKREIQIPLAALIAIGLLAAGLFAADRASSPTRRGLVVGANMTTVTTTYNADTQYVGKCAIVTPPTSDPCDAAQGTLRDFFWQGMVNATIFNTWRKQNPGDWARLQAHMATPLCSTGPTGQPQDMKTPFGAALYSEVQAYNCALGTAAITLPAPNPPRVAGATDKTPPSAPGPITAQTQPLTTVGP